MISVKILAPIPVSVNVGEKSPVNVQAGRFEVIEEYTRERYDGEYTVTPGDRPVMIGIKGKVGRDDIIVNPVPSNYGRIEFDGAILRIV